MKLSHLRVKGERLSLIFSFLLVLSIAVFVYQISAWLIILATAFQLFYTIMSQKQLIGNSLLVSQKQFPDIHSIAQQNAEELGIPIPYIFISQDPYINAFTIGFKSPYSIILNSALVEALTRDELDFIIGHEMGHIRFGHAKYLSLISPIGSDIPFISWLYAWWQRNAEYTADRSGYTLTHEIKPAISSLIKLSVGSKLSQIIDIDELIKQIELGQCGFLSKAGELFLTHPYTTNRILHLVAYSHFEEDR